MKKQDIAIIAEKLEKDINTFFKNDMTILMQLAINKKFDYEITKQLLDNGVDVNIQNKKGYTALIYASIYNNIEMVKFLITSDANINIKDNDGFTALASASLHNNIDIIRLLLDSGADINTKDNDNLSPLTRAVVDNNVELVKLFLDNKTDIDIKDKNGHTPLMKAILYGHKDIAQLLINNGADINSQDKNGLTILMMMLLDKDKYTKIIKNSSINFEIQDSLLDKIKYLKKTNISTIKFILDNNLDINIRNNVGLNACNIAKETNNKKVLKLLKERGGKDNKVIDFKREILVFVLKIITTILKPRLAIQKNLWNRDLNKIYSCMGIDILEIFKQQDLDPIKKEFFNTFKRTPSQHFEDIMVDIKQLPEYLKNLQKKIYDKKIINPIEFKNISIVDLVKAKQSYEVIEKAISNGMDIDAKNKEGRTALEYAVEQNNKNLVELLLKNGAYQEDIHISKVNNEIENLLLKYIDINDEIHIPKKLSMLLQNFSLNEKLKYLVHEWDIQKFTNGTVFNYDNFIKYFNEEWNEIKDKLQKISPELYQKIDDFVFCEDENKVIGFSTPYIKNQLQNGKKPIDITIGNTNFENIARNFKSLFVIKQDDKKLKLFKKFTKLKKELQLSYKLDLDDLKTDKIDKFFTDVEKFELGLSIILKDIDSIANDNNSKVIVKANEIDNFIEIKIIHTDSKTSKTKEQLLNTINKNGGNFETIYNNFKSICDWSVDTICSDGKRYKVDYLYQDIDNDKPHITQIDDTIEGFTHIIRFYK